MGVKVNLLERLSEPGWFISETIEERIVILKESRSSRPTVHVNDGSRITIDTKLNSLLNYCNWQTRLEEVHDLIVVMAIIN